MRDISLLLNRLTALLVSVKRVVITQRRLSLASNIMAMTLLVFSGSAIASRGEVPTSAVQLNLSFAPVVKKTVPAVVNVFSSRRLEKRSLLFEDPFFDEFFRRSMPQRRKQRQASALGSGVIVDDGGLIITNNHVVDGADEIRIALHDGTSYEAVTVFRDEKSDLAMLKLLDVDDKRFPTIALGEASKLEVGDLVLAVGNPFGVGQTVTMGIVSATARTRNGINDSGFFIQTDAAINPGNSGGALVNIQGELVGINTAIYSRSGGSIGIGFAIPVDLVRTVVRSVNAGRDKLIRPWFGATTQNISESLMAGLDLPTMNGALIVKTLPESPASMAGLQSGDVVLRVNGKSVSDPDALNYHLSTLAPQGTAQLHVIRDGQSIDVALPLMEAPRLLEEATLAIKGHSVLSGAEVVDITPLSASLNDYAVEEGVLITKIKRGSRAGRFGLRVDDILLAFNQEDVPSVDVLSDLIKQQDAKPSLRWSLIILRDGRKVRLAGFGF